MSDSRIAIVCATDDNYAPYCGVMLTSVLENNKDRDVSAYILMDKPLQEKQQKRFNQLSDKYGARIEFVMVDKSFFEKFPLKGDAKNLKHWSIVTYYRLYAEELLPKNVDKVLYLDCDIIVNRPIGELFDMNWDGFSVGAVSDMCTEWQEYYDRLQYDRSKGYFNAGVLFMNLEYWRTHEIGRKCVDYLASNYDRIFNNDQDIRKVLMQLINGFYSPNDPELFRDLYNSLLNTECTQYADTYFNLLDFRSYTEAHDRIEKVYRDEALWAKKAMLNVANVGKFSSDRTIQEYVDEIWHLEKLN